VSSFGFGGTNFHVTVEAYDGAQTALRRGRPRSAVVLLSAASWEELAQRMRQLVRTVRDLAFDAERSLQTFETGAPVRLATVATSLEELRDRVTVAANQLEAGAEVRVPGVWTGEGPPGPVAALFPGQGSQRIGMGGPLARFSPDALAVWDEVARGDDPVHRWVFPGFGDREAQAARLRATEVAQPAITTASLAAWAALRALGLEVQAVAGHSLGELGAAAAAGAWDTATAVRLARRRGTAMGAASANTPGAMLAVRAPLCDIEARLAHDPDLVVANHNAPDQVVVSGPLARATAFGELCAAAGLHAERLPVSTAFHSPLVADAADRFLDTLGNVPLAERGPQLWSNGGDRYPADPDAFRERLPGSACSWRSVRGPSCLDSSAPSSPTVPTPW
jgi:acyl transferase domain-containing protein